MHKFKEMRNKLTKYILIMKFFTRIPLLIALFVLSVTVSAQGQWQGANTNTNKDSRFAIKANLFYGAYTRTPNVGFEIGLNERSTLDIGFGYNPWNLDGKKDTEGIVIDNKKLVHLLGEFEYRYWLCEKFNGHFFGAHVLGSQYNIAAYKLPLLFGEDSEQHRYEGWAAGAGVSYGYQFVLGKHWNIEANIGVGYVYLSYDKYKCEKCGEPLYPARRDYIGPTKGGLSLIYIF